MQEIKKFSTKRVVRKRKVFIPKSNVSSWKMRATRLEHRRVEGKK